MRRCICIALLGTAPICAWRQPAFQSPAEESPHLLKVDTPDKGYLNLPVRITDRSTAAALSFDPTRDGPAPISYRLTRDGLIRIRVVWRSDPALVLQTLLDWTRQDFGPHSVVWDGRDASGNLVNNRSSFIVFEGDDQTHLAHPADDCHELGVEILDSPAAAGSDPLSPLAARLTRVTTLGRKSGFTVRCYLDYAFQSQVRLEGSTENFLLPCGPIDSRDGLLTINVDDGAGHVGVAGLRFRRGGPAVAKGRSIFLEKQCDACHVTDDAVWRESGPGLLFIGSRRPLHYLRRVVEDPHLVNRTSNMPKDPLTEDEVAAVVEYLSSLRRPPAAPRTGAGVYREEGCADCHDAKGEFGAMLGPALRGIGRLRTDSYLESVVLEPRRSYPRTAMPPTLLQPGELDNLVAYMREM